MALYELIERPTLDEPVLVLALEGWIDAGCPRRAPPRCWATGWTRLTGRPVLDRRPARLPGPSADRAPHRRRPAGLTWPEIELRAATDSDGNELLLLVGAEPDRLWHRFTDEVVTLALDFGVRMCVGLGAYPFAAPHTRPPRVACTASTPRLAEGGFLRASLDFPGGIQAAIEQGCDERGIPAIGLWAQIPTTCRPACRSRPAAWR